jgi:hypothetical protein
MKSKPPDEHSSHTNRNSRVYVWPVQARLATQQRGTRSSPLKYNQYMDTH